MQPMSDNEHTKYFVNGRQVPSVTQLIGDNLAWGNKYLLKWYRKNALKGIDPEELRDQSAAIGTLTHKLIQAHLMGTEIDTTGYSLQDKLTAKKAFNAALSWLDKHNVEVMECEAPLTHQKLLYGGTIDLWASVDGFPAIVDWKTSNNIYPKHRVQLAAYAELIYFEYSHYPHLYLIHLDKEYGVPREKFFPNPLQDEWRIFEIILELHELHKMVR